MTRDEAIERVVNAQKSESVYAGMWVDSLSALDILKLDEPKSVESRARNAVRGLISLDLMSDILNRLNVAGLRIVEK